MTVPNNNGNEAAFNDYKKATGVEPNAHHCIVLETIGIAASLGGNHKGCAQGPATLQESKGFNQACLSGGVELKWQPLLVAREDQDNKQAIKNICQQAAQISENLSRKKTPFLFLCGEHTYAMGIWRGVMQALSAEHKKIALIWIDAHMDAHTFITSPSGNIHGMPVAALLGQGDKLLTDIYGKGPILDARHLGMVGIRSFEAPEQLLLEQTNTNLIYMKQITKAGELAKQLKSLQQRLMEHADYFAFSIDIDAIDPVDAPAVGVPEENGIAALALCDALKQFNGDARLLGIEIAEYSPEFDQQNKTQQLISKIVCALYAKPQLT